MKEQNAYDYVGCLTDEQAYEMFRFMTIPKLESLCAQKDLDKTIFLKALNEKYLDYLGGGG